MNTDSNQQVTTPTKQEIATYAYYLWETEGRQGGKEMDYWLQAEAQLIADRKHNAALQKAAAQAQQKPVSASPIPAPAPTRIEPVKAAAAPVFSSQPANTPVITGNRKSRRARKKH